MSVCSFCFAVTTASISECQTERRLEVASQGGFISSSSAVQHGIGTSQCPWLIKANTGQKVHIYLYTFGVRVPQKTETGESLAPAESGPCREVAKVMEGGVHKMMELCPFRHGRHLVYVSQGSSVTVQLSQSNYLQDFVPFLIQYEGRWLIRSHFAVISTCTCLPRLIPPKSHKLTSQNYNHQYILQMSHFSGCILL